MIREVLLEVYELISCEGGIFLTDLKSDRAYFVPVRKAIRVAERKLEEGKQLFFLPNRFRKVTFEVNGKLYSGTKTKTEYVERVRFVFADIDSLGTNPVEVHEKVKERLRELPSFRPNLIVFSGGGAHVYWKIEETEDFGLWRAVQKEVARRLGGDTKVCNPNRAMRFFPSWNLKRNTVTKVLEFNPGLTYSLRDFAEFLNVSPVPDYIPEELAPPAFSVELPEEAIKKIVEMVRPFYREGVRNDLMLALVGMLIKKGISRRSVDVLFNLLTEDDEEKERRYAQTVEFQFRKLDRAGSFAGSSKLFEIFFEKLSENMSETEAKATARSIVKKIEEIIEESTEERYTFMRDGRGSYVQIVIRPTGMYVVTRLKKNGKFEKVEELLSEQIVKVISFNPDNTYTLMIYDGGFAEEHTVRGNELYDFLKKFVVATNYDILYAYVLKKGKELLDKFAEEAARELEEDDREAD